MIFSVCSRNQLKWNPSLSVAVIMKGPGNVIGHYNTVTVLSHIVHFIALRNTIFFTLFVIIGELLLTAFEFTPQKIRKSALLERGGNSKYKCWVGIFASLLRGEFKR